MRFTCSYVHQCPAFTAKCAHDLPPRSQIPHRLLAYYPDPVLSQYQSSTHRCRKQPKHPYPQVKRSTDLSFSFLMSRMENTIRAPCMDLIGVLVNRTWLTFWVCFSSTLIRKLGGFFIRRKMEETEDGKKDILYRSLLYAVSPTAFHVYSRSFLKLFCLPFVIKIPALLHVIDLRWMT